MREILFRGKAFEFGNWYCGDLGHSTSGGVQIVTKGSRIAILPETVGQSTDTPDKNNNMIFEGDIVKAYKHNEEQFIFLITYKDGCFWFGNWNWVEFLNIFRNYEVIGNGFDTPELLKGGEQGA